MKPQKEFPVKKPTSADKSPVVKSSNIKRKFSLPTPISSHQMTARNQFKRQISISQTSSTALVAQEEVDPDVQKLDLAEAMEKLPGWRPPAKKKHVVAEDEEEEENA